MQNMKKSIEIPVSLFFHNIGPNFRIFLTGGNGGGESLQLAENLFPPAPRKIPLVDSPPPEVNSPPPTKQQLFIVIFIIYL